MEVNERSPRAENLDLVHQIGSSLAMLYGLKVEQFIPAPKRNVHSKIRHASGLLKILLLENTEIPVEEIQEMLDISGSPKGLLTNAGTFKERLLLRESPQRVVSAESSLLKLDTVQRMLGLSTYRQLVQQPYSGDPRPLAGITNYPPYQLVKV